MPYLRGQSHACSPPAADFLAVHSHWTAPPGPQLNSHSGAHLKTVPAKRVARLSFVGLLHGSLLLSATATAQLWGDGIDWADNVLNFDPWSLDANGLIRPPDGKRALSYEFCIPAGEAYAAEVQATDPSARIYGASPGRIGCSREQLLVIGHTHQPDFAGILQRLADLPYVDRIDESHFE